MHCSLDTAVFDPYKILKSKTSRLSWSQLSDSSVHADKSAVIDWFALLRSYPEETVRLVVVEGLLENQLHNITFIFQLAQADGFEGLSSQQVYDLLYDFVYSAPAKIRECIDEKDYMMSRDVLALLSKRR